MLQSADLSTAVGKYGTADIVTKKAMANAIAVDMALGASSNTVLHLPATALAVRRIGAADVLLFGKQAADGDTAQRDVEVKKLIAIGKEKGFLTYDDVNDLLHP